MYVCMYVCIFIIIYICMYVCVYVCTYVYIFIMIKYIHIYLTLPAARLLTAAASAHTHSCGHLCGRSRQLRRRSHCCEFARSSRCVCVSVRVCVCVCVCGAVEDVSFSLQRPPPPYTHQMSKARTKAASNLQAPPVRALLPDPPCKHPPRLCPCERRLPQLR